MLNTDSTGETSKYLNHLQDKEFQFSEFIGKDKKFLISKIGDPDEVYLASSSSPLPYKADEVLIYKKLNRDKNIFKFYFKKNILIKIDVF